MDARVRRLLLMLFPAALLAATYWETSGAYEPVRVAWQQTILQGGILLLFPLVHAGRRTTGSRWRLAIFFTVAWAGLTVWYFTVGFPQSLHIARAAVAMIAFGLGFRHRALVATAAKVPGDTVSTTAQ